MNADAAPLRLLHHHAGYLRVQSGAFLGCGEDGAALSAVRDVAESTRGFKSMTHHPGTGSIVLEYEPGALDPDDLLERVAKRAALPGVERAIRVKMDRQELVSAFLDTVEDLNGVVKEVSGGTSDLRELVPVALAATSVVSFVLNDERGRLPSWDSAIYHSYRIFMQWHRREVRAREKAGRKEEERPHSNGQGGHAR